MESITKATYPRR